MQGAPDAQIVGAVRISRWRPQLANGVPGSRFWRPGTTGKFAQMSPADALRLSLTYRFRRSARTR